MRVLIADDHVLFRQSLRALLEAKGYEVVGEAGTGVRAVEEARRLGPAVVLMDLEMPELNGVEAMQRILEHRPEAQVVILTGHGEDEKLLRALQAGARGYLLKTLAPAQFFNLLEGLVRGEPALSPELARGALLRLAADPGRATEDRPPSAAGKAATFRFTTREVEVLALMAGGHTSTRALSERLGVGERTVKFHVGNLLQKMSVTSRAEAVAFALRRGLVEPAG